MEADRGAYVFQKDRPNHDLAAFLLCGKHRHIQELDYVPADHDQTLQMPEQGVVLLLAQDIVVVG